MGRPGRIAVAARDSRRAARGLAIAATLAGALASGTQIAAADASVAHAAAASSAFRVAWQADRARLNQVTNQIGPALSNAPKRTDQQLAVEFAGFARALQLRLVPLGSLKPPPSLAPRLAAVRTNAARAVADLRAIANAVAAHNVSAADKAVKQLVLDAQAVSAAAHAIDRALGLPTNG
jgi:hypothetical protein